MESALTEDPMYFFHVWHGALYIFDTIKYLENDMEQNKLDHCDVVERKGNF